ncbi:putative fused malic enzyme oxidoreductase; putative phosphotransacetylase [Candidatus Sulfopaludibacter sp. SbA6]|nr:putative fused malic enzyme oxidoreductase; putative phosphotransacetylase [Candidatus Sulfopaludibacter sp. SbA6]
MTIRPEDALDYHSTPPAGKVSVTPTKPCHTQRDLSLAYTPGVAVPCLEIERDPSLAYKYTAKANLVAVVSNGTAVLGLGNIGALAGKPVMEGKGVLFKRFADIDVFDIELATEDPQEVIRTCQILEPTFGGINLEDIKAPECFHIEEELRKTMKIPVFHDDQHGTAIISGAGLLNAIEIAGKDIGAIRVVFSGAGASAISCAQHYVRLGVKRENILMCDTKGVIYEGRTQGMNEYKARFAAKTSARTLAEALVGADVFFGLSTAGCVTPEMVLPMAPNPVIFALANPDPEITYEAALAARPDAIVATGRSDYPNQVNNVLGFPFIFRGALDVRATTINDEMKLAATRALAALAKEDVPDSVLRAYGVDRMEFGRDYIIPKAFDPRVLIWEASAVAQAAMDTGVAQLPVDMKQYREELEKRQGKAHEMMRSMIHKAQKQPKRIVFTEGEEGKILRACQILLDEKIAVPILLGNEKKIRAKAAELRLHLEGIQIVDPLHFPRLAEYTEEFYSLRQRKGITRTEAEQAILNHTTFGSVMVRLGDADALIGGLTTHYPDTIRPALQVIDVRPELRRVAGVYVLITPKGGIYFLADATVNIEPTSEDLAEIAIMAAEKASRFNQEPRVAMLSFSNFGSTRHPLADKVRRAVDLVRQRAPGLMIDGEMQADTAVTPQIIEETYPFSTLKGGANVLVFPNLEAGNIAYKLLQRIGGAELIGPLLTGLSKPVHVLQRGSEVNDIVHVAAVAVVDAQEVGKPYRTLAATPR